MVPTFETEGSLLHLMHLSDADQHQRLSAYWDIVRFLNASVPWPYPSDGALI